MKYIDISWPITQDMTTYKDARDVKLENIFTFENDGYRKSRLELTTHTGTHIDAPSHFLKNGGSVESISLQTLNGPCCVLDFSYIENKIIAEDLYEKPIPEGARVLFKTKNSDLNSTAAFNKNFVALDPSAAQFLVSCGIQCFGFDYLGIERDDRQHPVHKLFMNAGITILEGLRLGHVRPALYNLICLPLHIPYFDGAPVRAILEDSQ